MTFVLGMLCEDGIVMCSDSLEGDGYSKSNVKKLYGFTEAHGGWGVAWGCSGDSPVIKRFNDKVLDLLGKEGPAYDRYRLEELFESLVRKMRDDYPNDRLSLVAAFWGITQHQKQDLRLYSVKETSHCLSVEEKFACAGMDTSLGRFLLDSIYRKYLSVGEGEQLAVFVTAVMKEKADGVGGPTQLLGHYVSEKRWAESSSNLIAKAESSRYIIDDVEGAISVFFWHRTPHRFKPAKDDPDKCDMGS
jgi:20S proteasome alpha/beta subunit